MLFVSLKMWPYHVIPYRKKRLNLLFLCLCFSKQGRTRIKFKLFYALWSQILGVDIIAWDFGFSKSILKKSNGKVVWMSWYKSATLTFCSFIILLIVQGVILNCCVPCAFEDWTSKTSFLLILVLNQTVLSRVMLMFKKNMKILKLLYWKEFSIYTDRLKNTEFW